MARKDYPLTQTEEILGRVVEATVTLAGTPLPTTNAVYHHELGGLLYSHSSVSAALGSVSAQTTINVPTVTMLNPSIQIPTSSGTETWEIAGARGQVQYRAIPAGI